MSALRPERTAREASPSFVLLNELGAQDTEIALPDDEAHYVARVCRARAGEHLKATDGRGTIAELELLEVGQGVRARIERLSRTERMRESSVWCGPPEGERADWLIEKLAELGVARFQPLDTERGGWKARGTKADRWRRLAAAALRQSRQGWLMEILPACSLIQACDQPLEESSRWLADPEGGSAPRPPERGASIGVIGPSQGFTSAERSLLETRGFTAISLASGRLRTETAALAWAAWWASGAAG